LTLPDPTSSILCSGLTAFVPSPAPIVIAATPTANIWFAEIGPDEFASLAVLDRVAGYSGVRDDDCCKALVDGFDETPTRAAEVLGPEVLVSAVDFFEA
jgi:hypothetical protein